MDIEPGQIWKRVWTESVEIGVILERQMHPSGLTNQNGWKVFLIQTKTSKQNKINWWGDRFIHAENMERLA